MKYKQELVERICSYIRDGDTQLIACKKVGITETTFYEWKNNKNEFAESIKKAHDEFQETILAKLEATLWKKAQGYEVTETETEYINDKQGKPQIKNKKTKLKHIQPDTAALIFALTNVAPEKWKNRQSQDVKTELSANVNANVSRYNPEDFTDEEMQAIADKVQEAEHNRLKREKENAE